MNYEFYHQCAMDLSGKIAILGLAVAIVLTAHRVLHARGKDEPPLPPGPAPEPLLGHYRIVPEDAAFKQYAGWSKEYSTESARLLGSHPID